jgi:NAD(P)-dependent dehydrogenase (short-subunit alcohol dehydrogenase family)
MSEIFNLKWQVAVVTGGGGVLGGAMALGLAEHGVKVALLGRKIGPLNAQVKKIEKAGGQAIAIPADVLSQSTLVDAHTQIMEKWGRIDILINAAGGNLPGATISEDETFFDLSMEDFDKVSNLNLNGTVLPCMIFGAQMQRAGSGSIINISSLTATHPFTRVVGYSAAKAAIDNFTKWLAVEMALKYGEGIRVNAIAPGVFIGEQNRTLLLKKDGAYTERGGKIIQRTPMRRFGKPEELVSTVIFLCSAASSFVTGTVIPVDGGFLAYSGI